MRYFMVHAPKLTPGILTWAASELDSLGVHEDMPINVYRDDDTEAWVFRES